MGYIAHEAIVITGDDETLDLLGYKLRDIAEGNPESAVYIAGPTKTGVNGYASLLVAPDGSKEGWATSDEGDRIRADIREVLESPTKRGWFDWIEVRFGGDEHENPRVTRSG